MQRSSFLRSQPASFRRQQSWHDGARLWALLCLLPMLFLSVANVGSHGHESRSLSCVSSIEQNAPASSAVEMSQSASAAAPAFEMMVSLPSSGHDDACLLCQWASVAGACLMVALTLSFAWLFSRAVPSAFASSFLPPAVPLSLRARAPPL